MIPTALLPHTVQIRPAAGMTGTGTPLLGDAVTVRARVDGTRRMVRTATGQDVIGDAMAFVRPNVAVDTEASLSFDGKTYDVIDVTIAVELGRDHHKALTLQGPR